MSTLGLGSGIRVDEEVRLVARDREMLALQRLGAIGALRAEAVREEVGEVLARSLVGKLDPHSPVVGHTERIECFQAGAG